MLKSHSLSLCLTLLFGVVTITGNAADVFDVDTIFTTHREIQSSLDDLMTLRGLVEKYKFHIQNVREAKDFDDFVINFILDAKEFTTTLQSSLKSLVNRNRNRNQGDRVDDDDGADANDAPPTPTPTPTPALQYSFLPPFSYTNIIETVQLKYGDMLQQIHILEIAFNIYFNLNIDKSKEITVIREYSGISKEHEAMVQDAFEESRLASTFCELQQQTETKANNKSRGKIEIPDARSMLSRYAEIAREIICTKFLKCPNCSKRSDRNDDDNDDTVRGSASKIPPESWTWSSVIVFCINFIVVAGFYSYVSIKYVKFPFAQNRNLVTTTLFSVSFLYVCYMSTVWLSYVVELIPFYNWIYTFVFIIGGALVLFILLVTLGILALLADLLKKWAQRQPLFDNISNNND